MNKIQILTCGGTIDKDYGSGKGVYDFHIGAPCVGKILDGLGVPKSDYEIQELMRKDSLDMEYEDREKVYDSAYNSKAEKILITHGTDTMIKTGETLQQIRGKLIVILGASRPYAMKITDAPENLAFAWENMQTSTKSGVYIAMNELMIPVHLAEKQDDGNFVNLLH